MENFDGLVGIYSKDGALTDKLKEKFSQKYLKTLVSQDFEKLKGKTLSYLIVNLCDYEDYLSKVSKFINDIDCKILVLHPLYVLKSKKFVTEDLLQGLIDNSPNLGILLVPDILGQGVSYNPDSLSHDLIMQSILSERIKVNETSQLVNAISVVKLSEVVVREMFSFGISGQKVALIGPRKTKKLFITDDLNVDQQNIVFKKEPWQQVELHSSTNLNCEFSLRTAVKSTKDTFLLTTQKKVDSHLLPKEKIVFNKKQKESKIPISKKTLKALLFLVLLILTPFYLMLISATLLYLSTFLIFGNNTLAKTLVNAGLETSSYSKKLSFGNNFIYDSGNILYKSALLIKEGIVLADTSRSLVGKVMGDSSFDLAFETNSISASLDKLHTDTSFLQGDINDYQGFWADLLKSYLSKRSINIGLYKSNLYELKNLVSRSNNLLGIDKPKKYLILFQNNMELRPTGGFIGSFALATFDKGRLTEMVVNDVYSADGQLKGHVDPPEPIKTHLGEGGWYLRDSNWDPDFSSSAVKAEWFLDKEISQQVDGVIAIDLYFVKRLIGVIGQINLTDYNLTLDQNNLYQVIQSEVEDEFFPGSIKKASILTSLSRLLINEIRSLPQDKYPLLFKEVYQSLERKHIQVFLHDTYAQSALYNLGYTGQLDFSTECGPRCFRDSFLVVDANLGVNKANYFIKRDHDLNLTINTSQITHELFTTYDNSASPAIGNQGLYKNYARIVLPLSAKIVGIREYDLYAGYNDLSYDLTEIDGRLEAGFLIEVIPSTQKRIQVVWETPNETIAQGGQYDLNIFKQAGTDEDLIKINITTNNLSLTGKGISSYNTTLAKDLSIRLFLK
ncbi:MAG: DUF4012 domain-containing protein [bacterium]|nr:MAG: DUF4012 domain-containing protein [bacterium]